MFNLLVLAVQSFKKWRCWSRYAASREDPLRAVIPPPRGPASFPCSVNQPEAVRRSSSTLKPSLPRGPQCRVSFWNGAAAFGVGLNPRSAAHATNPSTHMPRKHGYSPLLRRAGELCSEGAAILRCAHPQGPRHYGTCNSAHINCWGDIQQLGCAWPMLTLMLACCCRWR